MKVVSPGSNNLQPSNWLEMGSGSRIRILAPQKVFVLAGTLHLKLDSTLVAAVARAMRIGECTSRPIRELARWASALVNASWRRRAVDPWRHSNSGTGGELPVAMSLLA
jgi:hypothetical protein